MARDVPASELLVRRERHGVGGAWMDGWCWVIAGGSAGSSSIDDESLTTHIIKTTMIVTHEFKQGLQP